MYGFDHGAWMLGGWIAMLALWLLPFVLVAVAVWFLIRNVRPHPPARTALDMLDEAYARGEITRDEFLLKRDDLRQSNTV